MPNGIVGEGGKIRSGFLFIYIYFKFTDWISWDGVYEPLIFLQLLWSRLLCSLGFRKCWNGTFNVLVKYILSVSMQSVSNPVHSCSRPIGFQFSCSIDVGHGTAGNIADSQLRSTGFDSDLALLSLRGFPPNVHAARWRTCVPSVHLWTSFTQDPWICSDPDQDKVAIYEYIS